MENPLGKQAAWGHNKLADLGLHPVTIQWFQKAFPSPTEVQRQGWTAIRSGQDTLIAAPTGSGKTLTAFLIALDQLIQEDLKYGGVLRGLPAETRVLYISPLKALSNDVRKNLEHPLLEIQEEARLMGLEPPQIRTLVRTGDTPPSQRQSMLRKPPHILVTTPESLYLLLTTDKGRTLLSTVKTVIVDEIHALIRDKRGSHLALSLARLDHICAEKPQRIGLSATQKPLEQVAQFLTGSSAEPKAVHVINVGHLRTLDLGLEAPASPLSAVCSHDQWTEVYMRLVDLIRAHQSTLIFVNTRKLAERVCFHLSQILGEDQVQSHHGSLAKEHRLKAEEQLKAGQLKAIVATASLELGIDVGAVDLVCQIGSPRAIATFLQRVGRAGHSVLGTPKGRLFALTRDELVEATALLWAVREGALDALVIPEQPLDILAQQVIAEACCHNTDQPLTVDHLWGLVKEAYPYRHLERGTFDQLINSLVEGFAPGRQRRSYLTLDRLTGVLRARKGARLAAVTSGGAIPELGDFRVVVEDDGSVVGSVNEEFALESSRGDVFLLGNSSWQIVQLRGMDLFVRDAQGAPPTIPFWFGESPGRTPELSAYVSQLRDQMSGMIDLGSLEASPLGDLESVDQLLALDPEPYRPARGWLETTLGLHPWLSMQLVHYMAVQKAAMGILPTQKNVVFERFFDDTSGMQLVIHSPYGMRINKGFGLALRKRFCRSFDFELQASADNDGIVLSLSDQQSFATDQLFSMLTPANVKALLEQAILQAPLFNLRWRWNTNRALAVLRSMAGKRIPPVLQRFRADDLMTAVFPAQTQCKENVVGDIPIPDHPLIRQTMDDCLYEAIDLVGLIALLNQVQNQEVRFLAVDTREPSPFSYQLLNAMPYAFLDDAPLEERRTRALTLRRTLPLGDLKDLARLDPDAIAIVQQQVWPEIHGHEDLAETLTLLGAISKGDLFTKNPRPEDQASLETWMRELQRQKRALEISLEISLAPHGPVLWVPLDQLDLVLAALSHQKSPMTKSPDLNLPKAFARVFSIEDATEFLVKSYMDTHPILWGSELPQHLGLDPSLVAAVLAKLESEGALVRGHFTTLPDESTANLDRPLAKISPLQVQWCERRLLARIHRLTIDGLRSQIKPVSVAEFFHFLVEHQGASPTSIGSGRDQLPKVLDQLQGFEAPAGMWESEILGLRIHDYQTRWLDDLTLSGTWSWGRLTAVPGEYGTGSSTVEPPANPLPPSGGMNRIVSISFCPRMDLEWMIDPERLKTSPISLPPEDPNEPVYRILKDYGALFFPEILAKVRGLESELQDQLSELSRRGLIHGDGFGAIRDLVQKSRSNSSSARSPAGGLKGRLRARFSQRSGTGGSNSMTGGGRWSVFPPPFLSLTEFDPEARAYRWAEVLLKRYGVVFKALLSREQAAPSWPVILRALRLMEARGEVRGGQFVAGPWGEQFAKEETIARLRSFRGKTALWTVIHAADPLNLVGTLLNREGEKVPATHRVVLGIVDGEVVAKRLGTEIVFLKVVSKPLEFELRQSLLLMGSFRSQLWQRSRR